MIICIAEQKVPHGNNSLMCSLNLIIKRDIFTINQINSQHFHQ